MQSLRKRLEALDWALFDKDKILKLLNEYSQWTERLHQLMMLILLVAASIEKASRSDIAQ